MRKLENPLRFDPIYQWVIIAQDGEKFYVCDEKELANDDGLLGVDIYKYKTLKSLLQWSMEVNYPIKQFVKLQKYLVETYFNKTFV